MNLSEKNNFINGISVCNPVDIEKDYLLYTVDYAIEHNINHMQFIGPIHDPVKGNIDGMTEYRKYSQFNNTKDMDYVKQSTECINLACEKTSVANIKTYIWHHELDLPTGFNEAFPEVLNENGDVEVSHPIVKDFLEHKVIDFFHFYPKIDGIILTLHETKVPLLKLKNQKLDKICRVKHVTKILFDICKSLGKELIVRPFASIEEDYAMMMEAYEDISHELITMDKWTQFDWSLCLPHNAFFNKVKNNPLFVEADIFGEFFGKGRLPLMLRQHINEKVEYCKKFNPVGFVARIDRAGKHPFGDVNEVNLAIMEANLAGKNVDAVINDFFEKKYPGAGKEVLALMEETEDIVRKIIYLQGYYYSELSQFPTVNHSKNHFYFEMMKEDYEIASNEWFIPIGWKRGTIESIKEEKELALQKANELFDALLKLEDKIESEEYKKLWIKFKNLKYVAEAWCYLTYSFINYIKYFETKDNTYKEELFKNFDDLFTLRDKGAEELGKMFFFMLGDGYVAPPWFDFIDRYITQVKESFEAECKALDKIEADVYDYIICGGGTEGHKLQKEVNFSDTFVKDGMLCRIPGNIKGMQWSTITAHGWFSYEIKLKAGKENTIKILAGSNTDTLKAKVIIGNTEYLIDEPVDTSKEVTLKYTASPDENCARISINKISKHTPCVFTIKVF